MIAPSAGVDLVSGPWSGGVGGEMDAISGATIDAISGATPGFRENRYELDLDGGWEGESSRLNAGIYGATESDTRSITGSLGGELDLFQENLTLGLSYGHAEYRQGEVEEPSELWGRKGIDQIDLSASQLLSPSTVVLGGFTFQRLAGELDSPYLDVPIFPADETLWTRRHAQWVHERHPDTRLRYALTLEGRQALTERMFLHAVYVGYLDSWAMRANTGELGVSADLGRDVILEVHERFYWQSSVSFYRSVYTVNRDYITRDRRLGEQWTSTSGLVLTHHGERLTPHLALDFRVTHYDDFYGIIGEELVPVQRHLAGIAQVGASFE